MKKPSEPGLGWMPGRKRLGGKKPVAKRRQHGHPRTTKQSKIEDDGPTVVAQSESGDTEGKSLQRPADESSQEVTESLMSWSTPVQV